MTTSKAKLRSAFKRRSLSLWYLKVLHSRWTPLLLLIIAIAERTAWSFVRSGDPYAGEAENVGLAIARGAGFADAYFVGSGPTAHLMPTTPLLAGIIFKMFGSLSPVSNVILVTWAEAQMVINYLLLFRLFERLGSSRVALLTSLATLCCLPVFLGQENLDFRYWEGGLALMFCLIILHMLLSLQSTDVIRNVDVFVVALVASFTFLLNPLIGLSAYLASLFLLTHRFSLKSAAYPILISAGVLVAVLSPWIIRNYFVMGHVIVLRDNAGLELSVANNDLTAAGPDYGAAFAQQMNALHPSNGGHGRERLLQVGEFNYMTELQRAASEWISSHPVSFARLCLRHLRQMYFPDAWQFEIGSGKYSSGRAALISFVSAFGMLGLLVGMLRDFRQWRYVGAVILTVDLLYMPFQPMPRYLYFNYGFLTFCAMDLFYRLQELLKLRLGLNSIAFPARNSVE